jgi:16S rRNA (adenine1518-N6/adenine1519-N6)-dimethyltransferase
MNLPSLRLVVEKYGLLPKKNLGQNFIFDQNITDKIVKYSAIKPEQEILEIGPGPGGLTRSILAINPSKLTVIEMDKRCIAALEDLKKYHPQLVIVNEDAMLVQERNLVLEKTHIIANLPYNVGTALLFKWFKNVSYWGSLTLMFQKEVADRIIAQPGGKDYGRLSVISQLLCDIKWHFDLKPEVFFPPPKITSSVISLYPKAEQIDPIIIKKLEQICRILFSQRRKMLRSSLKNIHHNIDSLIQDTGIDLTQRPEELSIEQFIKIAENYNLIS